MKFPPTWNNICTLTSHKAESTKNRRRLSLPILSLCLACWTFLYYLWGIHWGARFIHLFIQPSDTFFSESKRYKCTMMIGIITYFSKIREEGLRGCKVLFWRSSSTLMTMTSWKIWKSWRSIWRPISKLKNKCNLKKNFKIIIVMTNKGPC